MSDLIFCIECGQPWGIILERRVEPSDEVAAECRADLVDAWLEIAETEQNKGLEFDTDKLPAPKAVEVVYVTDATARWISDRDFADVFLGACWQRVDDTDLPGWLLKGRKRRWAYCWDCCNLGWSDNYLKQAS